MLAAALLLLAGPAVGQAPSDPPRAADAPSPLDPDSLVLMDFQDVELPTLVKFISEITGRNFLLDEKVQGRVSVISPNEITVKEAFEVFQSVLQVKGFTLVETGAVTKIIPAKDAKASGLPLSSEDSAGDSFVTRIIPLLHISSEAASSLLQPLVSREGLINAYVPTNSLIVVDTATNIRRLVRIVEQLDVPGQERTVEVIPLRYAFAGELADILLQAVEDSPGTSKPRRSSSSSSVTRAATGSRKSTTAGKSADLKIVADERSNSVVVIGSPFEIRQVRALIDKLDVPLPRGGGRIQVYGLRHADAVELVQVIGDLLGISVNSPSRQPLPGRSVTQGGGRFGNQRNNRGQAFGRSVISNPGAGSLGGLGGRRPPTAALRGSQEAAGVGNGGGVELEGAVRVTADPATNSLVIAAAPQDYDTIHQVIQKLDVPRRQVMVEAIIFEVQINKARELGIELQGGASVGGDRAAVIGQTNFKSIGAVNNALASGDVSSLAGIPGLLGALVSQQLIKLPDGTEVPAGIAMITALQKNRAVNVLSAPNILTSDNEEAEIVVGKNVPFVTSRSTSETNLSNTFSQIDRRDVGITLRLTPQITQGDSVRLFVFQEVSALESTSEAQLLQLGPTTSLRSATTTVVVEDGESVAIGGLIADRWEDSEDGVPFISDIPVLGELFKYESKKKEKVNLIILLTPRIVHNQEELRVLNDETRYRFREGMRARSGRFGATMGSMVPKRIRSLPAESSGILLPAVQLGAESGGP